jgi:hypothetical protein
MVTCTAAVQPALLLMIVAAGLSGCAEYVDRKDTIAFSAGNAVQTNIVTHVVDPWPTSSRNKNFATSGQRMQRAIENYRCGRTPNGTGDNGDGGASSGGSSSPTQGAEDGC